MSRSRERGSWHTNEEHAAFLVSAIVKSVFFALVDVEYVTGAQVKHSVINSELDVTNQPDIHAVVLL